MELVSVTLIILAYIVSRLGIPFGDGIAVAGVFAFARALFRELAATWLVEAMYVNFVDLVTMGVGGVVSAILGMRKARGMGALECVAGYAIGLVLGVDALIWRIASVVISLVNVAAASVYIGSIASVLPAITYVSSIALGGALAIVVIYAALLLTSFVNSSFSALNRTLYRTFLTLLDSPAWGIFASFGVSLGLTAIPALAWILGLSLMWAGLLGLWNAVGANLLKGTMLVAVGNALSGLGAAILLSSLLGDVGRIVEKSFRALGGKPSLGLLAFILAVVLAIGFVLGPLFLVAIAAYYAAMILSLGSALAEPRPSRRLRYVNAVADTLFTLTLAYHLSILLKEPINALLEAIRNLLGGSGGG